MSELFKYFFFFFFFFFFCFLKSIQPDMCYSSGFSNLPLFFSSFFCLFLFLFLFLIGWARKGCVCNRVVRHLAVITFPSVEGLK